MRGLLLVLACVLLAGCGVHLGLDMAVRGEPGSATSAESLIAQYRLRLEEYCAAGDLSHAECDEQRAHLEEFAATGNQVAIASLSGHTRSLTHRGARSALTALLRRVRAALAR